MMSYWRGEKRVKKNKTYGYTDMITLAFKTSPLYSSIAIFRMVFEALIPVFTIRIVANFINNVVSFHSGEVSLSSVFLPVVLLATVMVYDLVFGIIYDFLIRKDKSFFERN